MSFSAFITGANHVGFVKHGKKYGMICAWAMQADYDKVLMLLGAQSVTGKQIEKGDILGVSALSIHQKHLFEVFGGHHSDTFDKYQSVNHTLKDSAIFIDGASNHMLIEVLDVLHLEGIEEDNLIYGRIKEAHEFDVKKCIEID